MSKTKGISQLLFHSKFEPAYVSNYNSFVSNVFVLIFVIYLISTVTFDGYSIYFILKHMKHIALLQFNVIGLILVLLFVFLASFKAKQAHLSISQILHSSVIRKSPQYEIFYKIRDIIDLERSFLFPLFVISIFAEHVSISFMFFVSIVLVLAIQQYFISKKCKNNAIRYYLIGKMCRVSDAWCNKEGISFLYKLSLACGCIFLYFAFSILFQRKDNFEVLINLCIALYVIWSMVVFIVLNIYSGYLASEYTMKNASSKIGSVKMIVHVIWNIITKLDRIIGVTMVYTYLCFAHIQRIVLDDKCRDTRKIIDRVPVPRERYDQIEVEVLNYIMFRKYHKSSRSDIDRFMSQYWMVTKPMFIGKQLFAFAGLCFIPVCCLFVRTVNLFSTVIKDIDKMSFSDCLISLVVGQAYFILKHDKEAPKTGTDTDEPPEIINLITALFLNGNVIPYLFIPCYKYLLCGIGIFMLYFGARSFECMSFRAIFMLKDAHIEDSKKTSQKTFCKVINGLHVILLGAKFPNTIEASSCELEIYNIPLISTLDSI